MTWNEQHEALLSQWIKDLNKRQVHHGKIAKGYNFKQVSLGIICVSLSSVLTAIQFINTSGAINYTGIVLSILSTTIVSITEYMQYGKLFADHDHKVKMYYSTELLIRETLTFERAQREPPSKFITKIRKQILEAGDGETGKFLTDDEPTSKIDVCARDVVINIRGDTISSPRSSLHTYELERLNKI